MLSPENTKTGRFDKKPILKQHSDANVISNLGISTKSLEDAANLSKSKAQITLSHKEDDEDCISDSTPSENDEKIETSKSKQVDIKVTELEIDQNANHETENSILLMSHPSQP